VINKRDIALDSPVRVVRDHLLHMLGLRQRSYAVFKHTSKYFFQQYIVNNSSPTKAMIIGATTLEQLSVAVDELAATYTDKLNEHAYNLCCDCCATTTTVVGNGKRKHRSSVEDHSAAERTPAPLKK